MARVVVNDAYLTDIADAIRSKNGTQDTYTPAEMAEAIEAISGGGITPTGTKSITANGTGIDVAQYAYADVNVSSGNTVKYTRYELTGDTTIKQFIQSIDYEIQSAMGTVIMIRSSGTVAPSSGSYTLNNFIYLFLYGSRKYGRHYYKSANETPDSFPNLTSTNEDDNNVYISNGKLASTSTSTSPIGTTGDVVTVAEISLPVDNSIMNGGSI